MMSYNLYQWMSNIPFIRINCNNFEHDITYYGDKFECHQCGIDETIIDIDWYYCENWDSILTKPFQYNYILMEKMHANINREFLTLNLMNIFNKINIDHNNISLIAEYIY